MDQQLFRKKSIDRISSPEELHDYMRVTTPRLWMILGAIVLLLAGIIIYASTGTLENTTQIRVKLQASERTTEKGTTEAYTKVTGVLPSTMLENVKTGMQVRIGQEKGTLAYISSSAGQDDILLTFDMDRDLLELEDGEYDAVLVLESVSPMKYLWN